MLRPQSAIVMSFGIAACILAVLTLGHFPRHAVPEEPPQLSQTPPTADSARRGSGMGISAAAGTQFNISRRNGQVTVAVTEGSVLFTSNATRSNGTVKTDTPSVASQPMRLDKGQSVTFNESDRRIDSPRQAVGEPKKLR